MTILNGENDNQVFKALKSSDDSVRVEAVKALIRLGSSQLNANHEQVKAGAGQGKVDFDRIQTFLIEATDDENVAVRYYAKKGLKIFGNREQISLTVAPSNFGESSLLNPVLKDIKTQIHERLDSTVSEDMTDEKGSGSVVLKDFDNHESVINVAKKILSPLIQALRKIIENGLDSNVTASAAEALGFLDDRQSISSLISLVKKKQGTEQLIEALAFLQDSSVVPVFKIILESKKEQNLHHSVVKALLTFSCNDSFELIEGILNGTDTSLQCAVIRHMATLHQVSPIDNKYLSLLLNLTQQVPEFVDFEILRTLYLFAPDHPDVCRNLLTRLDHSNSSKIVASIISILGNSANSSYKDWISVYLKDGDRRVRANAVEALGKLPLEATDIKELLLPLVRDSDNRIASNASMILAKRGITEGWDGLLRMVNRSGKWYRASACYALGQIKHRDVVPVLSFALYDRDSDVRLNAVKALRNYVDDRAFEGLAEALLDRNRWIRKYAAEAISFLDTEEAHIRLLSYFREETNNNNLVVALKCCAENIRSQKDSFIPLFFEFLKHDCTSVRVVAIEALEYVMDRTHLSGLAPALGDKDSLVRARAVIAIWKHGEFSICDSLKTMLDSQEPSLQISAANVLVLMGRMLKNIASEPNIEGLLAALTS